MITVSAREFRMNQGKFLNACLYDLYIFNPLLLTFGRIGKSL